MNKSLAIITTIYKNYQILQDYIHSLEQQKNKNFTLFISDLSSERQPIKNNHIKLTVTPSYNGGYAHGINIGLKTAKAQGYRYFCVMNPDTFFLPSFTDNVLVSLESHKQSILGGKIYYAKGYEYHKGRYKQDELGKVIWYAGGITDWNNVYTKHRGVDEVDKGQYNKFEETDFITGCLMCFDQSIIDKVGYWDESYFLYYEDADFCERARKNNIPLYFDPSITLWHKNAQSTGGSGSPLHVKYQEKNRLKFGLKYAPFRTKLHLLRNHLFSSPSRK